MSTDIASCKEPASSTMYSFDGQLFSYVVLVVSSYLIPLLVGIGALRTSSSEWSDGYFAEVGMLIGGAWLKWWIQAASAMSNLGLFEAEMSGDAFQLLGMTEMEMLPAIFAKRSTIFFWFYFFNAMVSISCCFNSYWKSMHFETCAR